MGHARPAKGKSQCEIESDLSALGHLRIAFVGRGLGRPIDTR
jgi:hypothetical protein